MRRSERCCQDYSCGERLYDCCGGCCRALGYCQAIEQKPDCRVCEDGLEVRVTGAGPESEPIPCPRCQS